MRAAGLIATATLAALGCADASARPQVLLHLDTDAPVPRMMDRLHIEALDADFQPLCDACTRDVAIDETTAWPVVFGVAAVPPERSGERIFVRARLFPAGRTSAGIPQEATAIDRIVQVPPPDGIEARLLWLPLDCAGHPADVEARRSCAGGSPEERSMPIDVAPPWDGAGSRVGTWHEEVDERCGTEARRAREGLHDDDACIAGGTYWMGDWRWRGFGPGRDGVPEHAVAIRPFFLDRQEYTVGRFRQAMREGLRAALDPWYRDDPRLTDPAMVAESHSCNLYPLEEPDDPALDRLPLNCLSSSMASLACQHEGLRLPTEAEWEWAAGGQEEELLHPWGDAPAGCGFYASLAVWEGECPPPVAFTLEDLGLHGAPVALHERDRTQQGVYDLAGNVAEMVVDAFQPYDGDCWRAPDYGVSPRCPMPAGATLFARTVRGTVFSQTFDDPWIIPDRRPNVNAVQSSRIGFRCARDAP